MPREMVFYARQDTRNLIYLYTKLKNELISKGNAFYEMSAQGYYKYVTLHGSERTSVSLRLLHLTLSPTPVLHQVFHLGPGLLNSYSVCPIFVVRLATLVLEKSVNNSKEIEVEKGGFGNRVGARAKIIKVLKNDQTFPSKGLADLNLNKRIMQFLAKANQVMIGYKFVAEVEGYKARLEMVAYYLWIEGLFCSSSAEADSKEQAKAVVVSELLLCGDISENPGPFTDSAKTKSLLDKEHSDIHATQNLPKSIEVINTSIDDQVFVFGETDDESDTDSIEVILENVEDISEDSIQDYSLVPNLETPVEINLENLPNLCGEVPPNKETHEAICDLNGAEVGPRKDEVIENQSRNKLCSTGCFGKCSEIYQSWPPEQVGELKTSFCRKTILAKKKALLSHLIKQSNMGINDKGFFWNSHLFCVNFFAKITSISTYLINTVISDRFMKGVNQYTHGSSTCPRERPSTVNFIAWMVQHVELFGQDAPDKITKVMSSVFKRKELYQTYLSETQPPHIKLSTFYRHLKEKFGLQRQNQKLPNIRFSKYSSHSRCDVCTTLDQLQRTAKTEEKLKYCQALKFKHRERFGKARQAITNLKQLCLTFPNDYLMIHIDDMDNSKSLLPRNMEPGKKLSGCYKIPTKLTGTITSSGHFPNGRKVAFYYNHDEFPNGSNKLITVLIRLLHSFLDEFKFLPRHLYISLDNCFKENKNRSGSRVEVINRV